MKGVERKGVAKTGLSKRKRLKIERGEDLLERGVGQGGDKTSSKGRESTFRERQKRS